MKLLLYCTKSKPYLFKRGNQIKDRFDTDYFLFDKVWEDTKDNALNGKIVGECDFEVEELEMVTVYDEYDYDFNYQTYKTPLHQILKSSCLTFDELCSYLKYKNGYAIHIKNLIIYGRAENLDSIKIKKAPQNMMKCKVWLGSIEQMEECVLISIRPQWLCKILNGEKTIEVRKKVLKEMK